jgi:hypothetical protein
MRRYLFAKNYIMDTSKCKEQVSNAHSWGNSQCSRKATKDGYCKQHHPDTVKDRRAKQAAIYDERFRNSPGRKLKKAEERIITLENAIATHQREHTDAEWEDDAHAIETFIQDSKYYDE